MHKIINIGAATIINLIFIGCHSPVAHERANGADTSGVAITADSLTLAAPVVADTAKLDGTWYLQPVLPSDTGAGRHPEINFAMKENRFTGNTGCNRMSGSFSKTDSSLIFNQNMITTKMACPGYSEDAFIRNLLRANNYKFDGGDLILLFDATELSRWTRKLEKPLKSNKV